MLNTLRSKLTYANVMATLATFLALGGGIAWALANNSVKSRHIQDGQVRSGDLSDAVETQAFTYSASTGDDLQVEILDSRGYRFTAACENVGGRPALEFFLEFPEDGRLAGFAITDPSDAAAVPSVGSGVDIQEGVPFDGGSLEAPAGESQAFGSPIIYAGQTESAALNLHAVADDDDDICRLTGVLTPGIIPPA